MGSEEAEALEPKLGLFSVSPKMSSMMKSPPEPSGMLTPPLQGCSATVPFRWEEEPGKPRPCTALVITAAQLELPPRLAKQQPSPTTVLGGPYMKKRPKAASFRLSTTRTEDISHRTRSSGYGSFSFSPSPSLSPERSSAGLGVGERLHLGAIVLSKRWHRQSKEKGWIFGAWRARRKSELKGKARSEVAAGDSFVFPSDDQDKPVEEQEYWSSSSLKSNITRTYSSALLSSSQTKSPFWATIYGGLKQVIPWTAKKVKKTGFVN